MGMTESKKAQAVSALRQCAKEHEKDFTYTFCIRVSDLCNDIADYIEELQKENAELSNSVTELTNTKTELENKVTELEKEIDYYKSRECHWDEIEEDAKRIAEENEKLKKDKEWLDNTNNEQTEVILKLQAQIKKMKCCRNCKHFNQVEIHCDLYAKYECVNLDKWKLAE